MKDLVNSIPSEVEIPKLSLAISKQFLFYVTMAIVLKLVGMSLLYVAAIVGAILFFHRARVFYKEITTLDFMSDDYEISMEDIINDLDRL